MQLPGAFLGPNLKKLKKPPEKNPLCFEKGDFLALILKKIYMFLYFGKRKLRKKFVMFQETETLKKLLILTFLAQARKNFLYFWKRSLEKRFYIF